MREYEENKDRKKGKRKLVRTAKSEGMEGKDCGQTLRRVGWRLERRGQRATDIDMCSECCETPGTFPISQAT